MGGVRVKGWVQVRGVIKRRVQLKQGLGIENRFKVKGWD